MDPYEAITVLIEQHLKRSKSTDNTNERRKWFIGTSKLNGRGVFAACDIQPGEIIFKEEPLIIGPPGRKDTNILVCSTCFRKSLTNRNVCQKGCSLPVCNDCENSNQHYKVCEIYKSWEPIETSTVNRFTLRILAVVRALSLPKWEKELIYQMQANNDPLYIQEITRAKKYFNNFPNDSEILKYFYRVISVLNTNAFEVNYLSEDNVLLRGLYSLSSIINHQCMPNTTHYFENINDRNLIVFRATHFIPKGAELTTSYAKLLWNNFSRRMFLKLTKQFLCKCSRCSDPTENETFLCAVLCRKDNCRGKILPKNSSLLTKWKCLKCSNEYDMKEINKVQDFSLQLIQGKLKNQNSTLEEIIEFVDEKIPKFCIPTNQLVLEAKLNVINLISKRSSERISKEIYLKKVKYCEDLLETLEKLNAGECAIKEFLLEEIENTK